MKNANPNSIHPKHLQNAKALRRAKIPNPVSPPTPEPQPPSPTFRTTARDFVNPVDYQHPYDSMGQFAKALALRYDANRTRHAYYRQLRLIHEHFAIDPALLSQVQLRDYFLFVKLEKDWRPKSIRQALAASRQFFVDLLGHSDWTVFGQIRTKDHDVLPAVLTRPQVHALLTHIRLRRYRTPIKLIYACGLRLSECLGLTIHDIKGAENKLFIRNSKGHQDRVREFLVHLPLLQAAFRQHLRDLFRVHDWQVDPEVWGKNWGVHIQPAGNGGSALKYLGAYVARTAISDARILRIDADTVSFRWKNRDAGNLPEICTLPGAEFVARYLRHVLPRGLRSIRYYGFCHPAARVKRIRVQCHAGGTVQMGASTPPALPPPAPHPLCPCCRRPMRLARLIAPPYRQRGPPTDPSPTPPSPETP